MIKVILCTTIHLKQWVKKSKAMINIIILIDYYLICEDFKNQMKLINVYVTINKNKNEWLLVIIKTLKKVINKFNKLNI